MKTQTESLKLRQTYQPPRVEVLEIKPQGVLCGSALDGNATEAVTTGTFTFP